MCSQCVCFEDSGAEDLGTALKYMALRDTWKSAPRKEVLVKYADLYRGFFAVAKNGVVLQSVLEVAILNVHGQDLHMEAPHAQIS